MALAEPPLEDLPEEFEVPAFLPALELARRLKLPGVNGRRHPEQFIASSELLVVQCVQCFIG